MSSPEASPSRPNAEMGAAYLCGMAGITNTTVDNSAAYIHGWLSKLRNDKTLLVQAAAQAQKAADFILGVEAQISSDTMVESSLSNRPRGQKETTS